MKRKARLTSKKAISPNNEKVVSNPPTEHRYNPNKIYYRNEPITIIKEPIKKAISPNNEKAVSNPPTEHRYNPNKIYYRSMTITIIKEPIKKKGSK